MLYNRLCSKNGIFTITLGYMGIFYENCTVPSGLHKKEIFVKNGFKGSYQRLKFQDCLLRYLGSRIRLRSQNTSLGFIFYA